MQYASNQGVQIHYEVAGKGDPLLLVHGMFANWKTWRDYGYVEAMKNEYHLIMVDVRGHGRSDKTHDPKLYEEKLLASDLAAVRGDLNVVKAHYLGYSMGGWIGFAAAKYAPDRFHSFILGGLHPYSDMVGHDPNPIPTLREHGNEGIVAWLAAAAPRAPITLWDLNLDDTMQVNGENTSIKDTIYYVFRRFTDIGYHLREVATSKILHHIHPNLFIMWDNKIMKVYGVKKSPSNYVNVFLPLMKVKLNQVIVSYMKDFSVDRDEAIQKLNSYIPHKTMVKLLDEYNWINYTYFSRTP